MATDSPYDFAPEPPPPSATSSVPARAEAPVSPEDLAERTCPHCGFRIVGKPRRGRCPDCSAPLDRTAADLLQLSDARWLRAVSWGPLLVGVAVPLHVAGAVLMWNERLLPGLSLHLGAAAAAMLGTWLVTRDEQNPAAPRRRQAAAQLARAATLAVVLVWTVALVLTQAHRPVVPVHGMVVTALALLGAEACCLGLYLEELSRRIPSDPLAHQFYLLAWVLPALCAVLIVGQFVNAAYLIAYLFFFVLPMLGGLVGVLAWATVSLVRLTLELRQVAETAEALVEKRDKRAHSHNK